MKRLIPVFLALLLCGPGACSRPDTGGQLVDIRRWEDTRTLAGDSLVALLEHGRLEVRVAAARALGRIGDPGGIPPLGKCLAGDKRAQARAEAAFALGLIPSPTAAGPLLARGAVEIDPLVLGQIVLALGRHDEPGTAELVARTLDHAHPFVREQALESLALMADSSSVSAVLEATEDPVESVVWRATYALEKVPDERAVARLIELLDNPHDMVRAYAARALGRMGPPMALPGVEPLITLLDRGELDWKLRVNACNSLGLLGDARAGDCLARRLLDIDFHVRAAALGALARLEPIHDVRPVLEARRDGSTVVRHAAYGAIATQLQGDAYPYLREGLEDPSPFVVGRSLELLGQSHDPAALNLLSEALDRQDIEGSRSHAVAGLAALGGPGATALLVTSLEDDDWVVVTEAAAGLGELGESSATAALVAAYERWDQRGNVDVPEAVVAALGRFGQVESLPFLRAALNHDDRRIRLAARVALAETLPEEMLITLPLERDIWLDVRPVARSPLAPPLVVASEARQLILDTRRGRIVIDLFYDVAPQMVESFARLADSGFFDGLIFHRVVPNFVIQGGDPLGSGWGDAGYVLRSEWSPLRFDRGLVGIATNGKDTGSCQLFITHSPQPHLNARYTIFGKVVEGMDVVDKIEVEDRFNARAVWRADS